MNETPRRGWRGDAHKSNPKTKGGNMNDLKIGDVVTINSEDQVEMTVVHIYDGKAQCVFYCVGDHTFHYSPELPIAAFTKL